MITDGHWQTCIAIFSITMELTLIFCLLFSCVHSSIILFPVEEPLPSIEELACKARRDQDEMSSCIFPFIYRNQSYSKCATDVTATPWCAIQVDGSHRVVKAGQCSVELSERQCFPREFWSGATVYRENKDGEIPCQQDSDCPQLDAETLKKTLGFQAGTLDFLPEELNLDLEAFLGSQEEPEAASVGCSAHLGICTIGSDSLDPAGTAGSFPLTFTTSTASQGFLPGSVDVSAFAINKNSRRGSCGDPSTCRRGNHCCSVVWVGSNRQFICPHSCF